MVSAADILAYVNETRERIRRRTSLGLEMKVKAMKHVIINHNKINTLCSNVLLK